MTKKKKSKRRSQIRKGSAKHSEFEDFAVKNAVAQLESLIKEKNKMKSQVNHIIERRNKIRTKQDGPVFSEPTAWFKRDLKETEADYFPTARSFIEQPQTTSGYTRSQIIGARRSAFKNPAQLEKELMAKVEKAKLLLKENFINKRNLTNGISEEDSAKVDALLLNKYEKQNSALTSKLNNVLNDTKSVDNILGKLENEDEEENFLLKKENKAIANHLMTSADAIYSKDRNKVMTRNETHLDVGKAKQELDDMVALTNDTNVNHRENEEGEEEKEVQEFTKPSLNSTYDRDSIERSSSAQSLNVNHPLSSPYQRSGQEEPSLINYGAANSTRNETQDAIFPNILTNSSQAHANGTSSAEEDKITTFTVDDGEGVSINGATKNTTLLPGATKEREYEEKIEGGDESEDERSSLSVVEGGNNKELNGGYQMNTRLKGHGQDLRTESPTNSALMGTQETRTNEGETKNKAKEDQENGEENDKAEKQKTKEVKGREPSVQLAGPNNNGFSIANNDTFQNAISNKTKNKDTTDENDQQDKKAEKVESSKTSEGTDATDSKEIEENPKDLKITEENPNEPKVEEKNPNDLKVKEENPDKPKMEEKNPDEPKMEENNPDDLKMKEKNPDEQKIKETNPDEPKMEEKGRNESTKSKKDETDKLKAKKEKVKPEEKATQESLELEEDHSRSSVNSKEKTDWKELNEAENEANLSKAKDEKNPKETPNNKNGKNSEDPSKEEKPTEDQNKQNIDSKKKKQKAEKKDTSRDFSLNFKNTKEKPQHIEGEKNTIDEKPGDGVNKLDAPTQKNKQEDEKIEAIEIKKDDSNKDVEKAMIEYDKKIKAKNTTIDAQPQSSKELKKEVESEKQTNDKSQAIELANDKDSQGKEAEEMLEYENKVKARNKTLENQEGVLNKDQTKTTSKEQEIDSENQSNTKIKAMELKKDEKDDEEVAKEMLEYEKKVQMKNKTITTGDQQQQQQDHPGKVEGKQESGRPNNKEMLEEKIQPKKEKDVDASKLPVKKPSEIIPPKKDASEVSKLPKGMTEIKAPLKKEESKELPHSEDDDITKPSEKKTEEKVSPNEMQNEQDVSNKPFKGNGEVETPPKKDSSEASKLPNDEIKTLPKGMPDEKIPLNKQDKDEEKPSGVQQQKVLKKPAEDPREQETIKDAIKDEGPAKLTKNNKATGGGNTAERALDSVMSTVANHYVKLHNNSGGTTEMNGYSKKVVEDNELITKPGKPPPLIAFREDKGNQTLKNMVKELKESIGVIDSIQHQQSKDDANGEGVHKGGETKHEVG